MHKAKPWPKLMNKHETICPPSLGIMPHGNLCAALRTATKMTTHFAKATDDDRVTKRPFFVQLIQK